MLRTSALRLISEKWAVCSAQIQSLIVDGQNDPTGKLLQSARGFLRDVDIDRVVVETDDALELLYFMQRVDYPKGSKLEANATEWLQRHADTFEIPQLRVVCQYAIEKEQRTTTAASPTLQNVTSSPSLSSQLGGIRRPSHVAAVELWHRAVLQRSWFRSRTLEWIEALDLPGLLTFAKVTSWSWDAAASHAVRSTNMAPSVGVDGASAASPPPAATAGSADGVCMHADNDTAFVKQALYSRCAALLRETVSSNNESTRCTLRPDAQVMSQTTLLELLQYVLRGTMADVQQYGQRQTNDESLFEYIDAHVERLNMKDTVRLVHAISGIPNMSEYGYAATRIVKSLLEAYEAAAKNGKAADQVGTLLSSGTQLGFAALKVLQAVGWSHNGNELPPMCLELMSLCKCLASPTCLPASLVESELTPEAQESVIALASLLAGLQGFLNQQELEVSTQLRSTCGSLGASISLQLLVASTLHHSDSVNTLWMQWCQASTKGSSGGAVAPVTAISARNSIRALAIVFLHDDSTIMTRANDGSHTWLQPGTAAAQRSLTLIVECARQILDTRHGSATSSVADLCAVMYVEGVLNEKQLYLPSSTQEGVAIGNAHRRAAAEQLLQRIAHSSKFAAAASGGTGFAWSLDMARMVIHSVAAAECGAILQSFSNVMEQLHRVIQQELSDVQRDALRRERIAGNVVTSGSSLTVGACAALLIAMSDAQLSKTQLARNVLQMVVLLAPRAEAEELARCLTILPIIGIRDIHAACTLMRELRERDNLPFICVVEAADAARRLRITQHFQQCKVSERVSSILLPPPAKADDYLPLEQFSVLMSACTIDEQRRLFDLAQSTNVPAPVTAEALTPTSGERIPTTSAQMKASKKKIAATPSPSVPSRTVAAAYLEALPSFLAARPSTALNMLACPECPDPFLHCIANFLASSTPLSPDDADTSAFLSAVSSIDEMIAKQKQLKAPPTSEASAFLSALFTNLVVFGTELILQMDESSLMQVNAAAGHVSALSNRFFRVVGRRITPIAEGMTPENSLSCLELYAKYNVRDDRVVKALLSRCIFTMGMIGGSADLSTRLRRVIETFPHWSHGAAQALQKYGAIKARRERRMT